MPTFATFWFNKEKGMITEKVFHMFETYIKYVRRHYPEEMIVLFTYNDAGHVKNSFSSDTIKVIDILEACPREFRNIYSEGNDIYPLIDYGKHLMINYLFNKHIGPYAVSDLDIKPDMKDCIHVQNWFDEEPKGLIIDNNENQIYIFADVASLFQKHYEYFVEYCGRKMSEYALKGFLRIDVKRILMGSYLAIGENPYLEKVRRFRYSEEFRKIYGNEGFDFEKLLDQASKNYVPLTRLNILYYLLGAKPEFNEEEYEMKSGNIKRRRVLNMTIGEYAHKNKYPFEETSFNESGMTEDDLAFVEILTLMARLKKQIT
jgi:hypothetical protein